MAAILAKGTRGRQEMACGAGVAEEEGTVTAGREDEALEIEVHAFSFTKAS